MIDLTVIIPIYNVENYIESCLNSVLIQTLKNIEIICINDASTDASLEILNSFAKKDKRIKIINNLLNKGVGIARQDGLTNARGLYVAFIDADDYISEEYLEDLYYTARIYNADIAFTSNIYTVKETINKKTNEIKHIIKPYYHNRVIKWMNDFRNKKGNWYEGISRFDFDTPKKENSKEYPLVLMWNKVFRLQFIKENQLLSQNLKVASDVDFFYKALALSPKIAYNHKAIYYYLQRKSSITYNVKTKDEIPSDILKVFENVFLFNKKYNIEKLEDSTYWNFKSFMHTFENYKGSKKEEFYLLTHNLFKSLNATIKKETHPFESYAIEAIKANENYSNYIKSVQNIKLSPGYFCSWIYMIWSET